MDGEIAFVLLIAVVTGFAELEVPSVTTVPVLIRNFGEIPTSISTIPLLVTLQLPNLTDITSQQISYPELCANSSLSCNYWNITQQLVHRVHTTLEAHQPISLQQRQFNPIKNDMFENSIHNPAFLQWTFTTDAWNEYLLSLYLQFQDKDVELSSASLSLDPFNTNSINDLHRSYKTGFGATPSIFKDTLWGNITTSFFAYTCLVEYYAQLLSVLTECRNHFLPTMISSNSEFQTKLKESNDVLHPNGHEISVDFNTLLNMRMASCAIVDTSIEILLKLPIKKINETFELIEINQIPYLRNGSVCSLQLNSNYLLKSDLRTVTVIPSMRQLCSISKTDICPVPLFQTESTDLCLIAVEQNDHHAVQKFCKSTCTSFEAETSIRTINGEIIVVGGNTFAFTCEDNNSLDYSNSGHINGTVMITLPCTCNLTVNGNNQTITPPFPCPRMHDLVTPNITKIIPIDLKESNFLTTEFCPNNVPIADTNLDLSDTNILYFWLTVLTFLYLSQIRGNNHHRFLPVNPTFMLFVVNLAAATEDEDTTVFGTFMDFLGGLGNYISFADTIVLISGFIIFSFICTYSAKLYSIVPPCMFAATGAFNCVRKSCKFFFGGKQQPVYEMSDFVDKKNKEKLHVKHSVVDVDSD